MTNFGGQFYSQERLEELLREFRNRLYDDLKIPKFLSLNPQELALYDPSVPLFGLEVASKFQTEAEYEIDQAGKALALGLSTAGAFHSIRVLEVTIRAISRCLGIPDPTKVGERSWGKLLEKIEKKIDERWPTDSNRMDGNGQFFDEAYASLAAMRNPYRNSTMHLDQKYTDSEARHIFEVVRGFMMKVASRMDEDGNEKA